MVARGPRPSPRCLGSRRGVAATGFIAFAFKYVLPHPGPPPELQRRVVRYGFGIAQPFSFPSGHTMRTTFFAATALRRAPAAAGALVLAMMTALVYLGDHWVSDVLGGLCLGWACAEIGRWAYGTFMPRAADLINERRAYAKRP